jgi:RNA polymerase sigma factor (sigma-70 family)
MTTKETAHRVLQHIRRLVTGEEAAAADADMLSRFAAQRDEAAFAELVRRHGPMVLGVCHRLLGREQDAEDVFQAAFLVLARKAGSVRRGRSLGSFLYGVALRLAKKARADAARRPPLPRDRQPMLADPLAALTARELLQALHEEIGQLPERYRAPVVLCHLQGRTQEGAAAELGWSKATLRRRLDRARALLRARLVGRGITLPAGTLAALAVADAAAAVPAPLVEASLQAVRWFLSGRWPAASVAVAALAEHGVRLLAAARFKVVAALALPACLLCLTTGMVARQAGLPADAIGGPAAGAVPPAGGEVVAAIPAPASAAPEVDIDACRRDLCSTEPQARRCAPIKLGWLGPAAEPALPELLRALRDPDRGVAHEVCNTLARIGPKAAPVLAAALRDDDPRVRGEALDVLFRLGPDAKAAVLALAECVEKDPQTRTRILAAVNLGRLGPEAAQALPALTRAAGDRRNLGMTRFADYPSSVCEAAVAAVKRIDPHRLGAVARGSLPSLLAMLRGADPGERQAAVGALALLGPHASHSEKAWRLWSRPSAPCDTGRRPNSPVHRTMVESSSPRRFRSVTSPALGRSVMAHRAFSRAAFLSCVSHGWPLRNTCTKRTPCSTRRRASRQRLPYSALLGLSSPYRRRVSSVSFERSSTAGTDVCIRAASS